jgi:hypothetical protein
MIMELVVLGLVFLVGLLACIGAWGVPVYLESKEDLRCLINGAIQSAMAANS